MTDGTEAVLARVLDLLRADSAAQSLGITVSFATAGAVTAHMTITDSMLNRHGTAHGAVLFAVADVAFAMACNSHGGLAVGRSCHIEYLAPARSGEAITATAVERSRAGRSGIYDVAVTRDRDGHLLAELRGHSRLVSEGGGPDARAISTDPTHGC